MPPQPVHFTLGTAGHVDHGKTALVTALTGVNTDRLPVEQERGMSIVLGFASLPLKSGGRISIVDVPGHQRFVRTMVSGATGFDGFMLVVAADDGVMPQTVEHLKVLNALGVDRGLAVVTKIDRAPPGRAKAELEELLPNFPIVECSARSGENLDAVADAIFALVRDRRNVPGDAGAAVLHVDRVFSVDGAGTIVTGTLCSGVVRVGDRLEILPSGASVRVRSLQVHDVAAEHAAAGQRVAVNFAGLKRAAIGAGDALCTPGALRATRILNCRLDVADAAAAGDLHLHHGTRHVSVRLVNLADGLWQARLESPVFARNGDRVVVRSTNPPATLGGGEILDIEAMRHGKSSARMARLKALAAGVSIDAIETTAEQTTGDSGSRQDSAPRAEVLAEVDPALEHELISRGLIPYSAAPGSEEAASMRMLAQTGRAVRVATGHYLHPSAVARLKADVAELIARHGAVGLPAVRTHLGMSRREALLLLEFLDSQHFTRRGPDNLRALNPKRS